MLMESVEGRIDANKYIRTALVTDVRKKDKKVRVTLLPEKMGKSGWLRVYWLNNLGSGQLPPVDSEVVVMFIDGNQEAMFILAGGFLDQGDETEPPQENDFDIIDKYGNRILMQDGKIQILSGSIELGDEQLKRLVNENFLAPGGTFLTHHHIDPLSGTTGPVDPSTVIPPSDMTSVTKAK
jgi:hypothetical protein